VTGDGQIVTCSDERNSSGAWVNAPSLPLRAIFPSRGSVHGVHDFGGVTLEALVVTPPSCAKYNRQYSLEENAA
jgi:hypothetical protein